MSLAKFRRGTEQEAIKAALLHFPRCSRQELPQRTPPPLILCDSACAPDHRAGAP